MWEVRAYASYAGWTDSPVYTRPGAITIADTAPTAPTLVAITPSSPLTADALVASASGSSDVDSDAVTYEYRWYKGGTLTAFTGATLPSANTTKGEVWKVEARAAAGGLHSSWVASATVTIGDTAPTNPIVSLSPTSPLTTDNLIASASGSSDADSDAITYQYRWYNGATLTAFTGANLSSANTTKGEVWKAEARASAGGLYSSWVASATVTIGDTAPTAPTLVAITPVSPLTADALVAAASGSGDADSDAVTYEYRWYNGGTLTAFTGATLSSIHTTKGDVWYVEARAAAGGLYSAWVASDSVTIGDTAPTAPDVIILQGSPLTTDDLVALADNSLDPDDDAITYEYRWYKDGTLTAFTGATLSNADTAKGDVWYAEARAAAGGLFSAWVESAPVTIGDTAPTAPEVSILQTSPLTTDDLVASASGSSDVDSDAVTYEYRWYKSGILTAFTDATLSSADTYKGEEWTVEARAAAGGLYSAWVVSDSVIIGDSAPSAPTSASIAPSTPLTNDDLIGTAEGGLDPDSLDNPVSYDYKWQKFDGADFADAGFTGATLDQGNTTKGDQWRLAAQSASNGLFSDWTYGDPVTIGNTAPTAPTSLDLVPPSPLTTDTLSASAGGSSDADLDGLSYQYQWAKSTDGGGTWTDWGFDGSTVASAELHVGNQWKARARANDGTVAGEWLEGATVLTIGNTAPTAPTVVTNTTTPALTDEALTITASDSTDVDSDTVTYEYAWQKWDGSHWADQAISTATVDASVTTKGDRWRGAARAFDGTAYSVWVYGTPILIVNSAPTTPTTLVITPQGAHHGRILSASASGSTDADGDAFTYRYMWEKSTDGGSTWGTPITLAHIPADQVVRGNTWRCSARAYDGAVVSAWIVSDPITILNGVPTAPSSVTTSWTRLGQLKATATGSTDPESDPLTYRYAWYQSTDGGSTWNQVVAGRYLDPSYLVPDDMWKALARANDGTVSGPAAFSDPVTIGEAGSVSVSAVANATSNGAAVTVNLTAAADVTVVISNMAGRQIAVINAGTLPAGISSLAWNGRSLSGTLVPSGRYFANISAKSASGTSSNCSAVLNK